MSGSIAIGRFIELLVDLTATEGSQAKAGKRVGLSQQSVSAIVDGRRKPSIPALETAARKLGLDPCWFFEPFGGDWRGRLRGRRGAVDDDEKSADRRH